MSCNFNTNEHTQDPINMDLLQRGVGEELTFQRSIKEPISNSGEESKCHFPESCPQNHPVRMRCARAAPAQLQKLLMEVHTCGQCRISIPSATAQWAVKAISREVSLAMSCSPMPGFCLDRWWMSRGPAFSNRLRVARNGLRHLATRDSHSWSVPVSSGGWCHQERFIHLNFLVLGVG